MSERYDEGELVSKSLKEISEVDEDINFELGELESFILEIISLKGVIGASLNEILKKTQDKYELEQIENSVLNLIKWKEIHFNRKMYFEI